MRKPEAVAKLFGVPEVERSDLDLVELNLFVNCGRAEYSGRLTDGRWLHARHEFGGLSVGISSTSEDDAVSKSMGGFADFKFQFPNFCELSRSQILSLIGATVQGRTEPLPVGAQYQPGGECDVTGQTLFFGFQGSPAPTPTVRPTIKSIVHALKDAILFQNAGFANDKEVLFKPVANPYKLNGRHAYVVVDAKANAPKLVKSTSIRTAYSANLILHVDVYGSAERGEDLFISAACAKDNLDAKSGIDAVLALLAKTYNFEVTQNMY